MRFLPAAITGPAFALSFAFLASCKPAPAEADVRAGGPVEEAGYVEIGGIEQWITITGADRDNPVVLFLHGGPGIATSPFAESGYAGLEQAFTLVQWDQRGAGRTFARTGESIAPTMTVERMTQDGVEVAEYLRRHLDQDRIVITGGSWGSVLGIRMAHERPDLFHAYIGVSQSINWRQDQAASFARVRELAAAKGDRAALDVLDNMGPPWGSPEERRPFRQVQLAYQEELATDPGAPIAIAPEYQTDFDSGAFGAAADFSSRLLFGPDLSGPLMSVDNTGLTDFDIPIFVIHGEVDLTIPLERAQAYFDTIQAPRKALYVAPGAGHNPTVGINRLQRDILLTEVRPLVVE